MPGERAARRFLYSAGHVPPGMARRYRRSSAETVVPAASRRARSAALPVFRRAWPGATGELQPPGNRPATSLRPNTPTRPGRGKGPDRPSHPGPDQLSMGGAVSCAVEWASGISSSCSRCTPASCSRV